MSSTRPSIAYPYSQPSTCLVLTVSRSLLIEDKVQARNNQKNLSGFTNRLHTLTTMQQVRSKPLCILKQTQILISQRQRYRFTSDIWLPQRGQEFVILLTCYKQRYCHAQNLPSRILTCPFNGIQNQRLRLPHALITTYYASQMLIEKKKIYIYI